MRGLLLFRGLRVLLTVLEEEEESLRLRWSDGIESLRRPPDPAAPTLLPEPGVMADSGFRSVLPPLPPLSSAHAVVGRLWLTGDEVMVASSVGGGGGGSCVAFAAAAGGG